MKKFSWLILIIVLLTACNGGSSTPAPVDTGPRPTPTVEVVPPPSPTPSPDAYPVAPAPTPLPDNYPPPPTPAPPTSPYPTGEFVWLLLPVGTQGEETKTYDDLQTAVQALASAGVAVKTAGMTDLVVCAAVGCPTSAHYRVEIDVAGLETAAALGWVEE